MMCASLFTLSYEDFEKDIVKKMVKNLMLSSSEKGNEFKNIKFHFVYLSLVKEIFGILHKNMNKEEIPKALEMYIQENLMKVVGEFEVLGEKLKNKFLKFSSIEDFGF